MTTPATTTTTVATTMPTVDCVCFTPAVHCIKVEVVGCDEDAAVQLVDDTVFPLFVPVAATTATTAESRNNSSCSSCNKHMTAPASPAAAAAHKSSNGLINASKATSTTYNNNDDDGLKKSKLDTSMQNLNAYFMQFHQVKADLTAFEDAYERCRHSIRSGAAELVRRIHEHETRLLDELETQRETEYKRAGLNVAGDRQQQLDSVENNLLSLQRLCATLQTSHDSVCSDEQPQQLTHAQQEEINVLLDATSHIDVMTQQVSELRHSVFHSVRCNTAFGTIDLMHKRKQSVPQRQHSMCLTSLPPLQRHLMGSQ